MRAVVLSEAGSAPQLMDIPVPEPQAGEVRVRIHAAAVNAFDLVVAKGYLQGLMEHRFPVVLGKDFAGVVDAVGAGVEGYAEGDRVFGVVTKPYLGDGSFAEFVTVPVDVGLALLPASIGFADAAGLGLAGSAALDAIEAAKLDAGSTVLISGATGGVGTAALQLAAAAGATVIATARSDAGAEQVTTLGAAQTIGSLSELPGAVLALHPGGIDAVVHLAGDAAALLPVLRPGGRLVSLVMGALEQLPAGTAEVVPVNANPTGETLARLAENLASGITVAKIQHSYPLEEAPAAMADFAAGTLGKLIIIVA